MSNVLSNLSVQLIVNPNNTSEVTVAPKEEPLSFDKGFFVAVKAIQLLKQKISRTIIVCIAGPSGAGKTSLASKIAQVIPKSLIIALDNYLDSTHVIEENYDDYRLVDFDLLVKNINDLREGRNTDLPLYDYRKSGRYAYLNAKPPESRVVIVEGIYALHEKVRRFGDLAISVSGGVHFDLVKRIFRDIQRTGQEPHQVIQQITETVYPMYKAFIEPDLEKAQIKIVNEFNPFSGLLNPVYTLKSAKVVSTETIQNVLPNPPAPPRTEQYYDIYLRPPMTRGVKQAGDWIRMRNNGGTYTILFSETLKEDDMIISPCLDFVVNVRILGGLMALGYQIAAIIHRKSVIFGDDHLSVTIDTLEELGGQSFLQVKGTDRKLVQETGEKLGLAGSYMAMSYIEIYMNRDGKWQQFDFTPIPTKTTTNNNNNNTTNNNTNNNIIQNNNNSVSGHASQATMLQDFFNTTAKL